MMLPKKTFFLLAVFFLTLFIRSADAKCLIGQGNTGVINGKTLSVGGGCGGGGGGTHSPYTLQGHVDLDLNGTSGSGIDQVHMVFEKEDAGCDGTVNQLGDVDLYTLSGNDGSHGNYLVNLTSGVRYCITLSKTGFYTTTYNWQTAGSGEILDLRFREVTQIPNITQPADANFIATVGTPFSVTFQATDANQGDQVTLSTVTCTPSCWLTQVGAPNPGNPASLIFSGTPATVGTYTLTVRPSDVWLLPNDASKDKAITVTVQAAPPAALFEEVSSNLPADTNRTPGADAGDIDGDGDMDLVIAHPPSSTFGTRILINDGTGHFRDGTSDGNGRWPFINGDPRSDYRSYAVRLARQGTSRVPDLFITAWERVNMGWNPPPLNWFERTLEDRGLYYCQESGQPMDMYRLRNNGSGYFTTQDSINFDSFFMLSNEGCWNGSFGSDIEVGVVRTGYLHAFFANTTLGESLPNNYQFAYFSNGEVFYWQGDYPHNGYGYEVDDFSNLGIWGAPRTGDFELADVDGDGDLDLFAGAVSFSGFDEGGRPSSYNYAPTLWRNIGAGTGTFESLFDLSLYALNGSLSGYFEQKAQFADLNGDGKQDLIFTDLQHGLKLLRNNRSANGDGNFSFVLDNNPSGIVLGDAKEIVVGDVDGDSKPDLILIGSGAHRERLFINTTSSTNTPITFVERTNEPFSFSSNIDDSNGGLLFDMDGDGDADLLIYNNGQNKLYRNKTIDNGGGRGGYDPL